MKIIGTSTAPIVTVVGCLHGDETFGARVIEALEPRLAELPGLRLILANVEAIAAHKRFIDDDLNRSFPGDSHGHHEQRLAHALLPHITGSRYVLDIHTTTSDIQMTPIVAKLTEPVRYIINLTTSPEVALMTGGIADHALIGQVPGGVSLEFNEDYARTDAALAEAIGIIEELLAGRTQEPSLRRVFNISGTIALSEALPPTARNFEMVPTLGVYPFLLHERAYVSHQGFAARDYRDKVI